MKNNYISILKKIFIRYWKDYIYTKSNKKYYKVLMCSIVAVIMVLSILKYIVTKSILKAIGFFIVSVIFMIISFMLMGIIVFALFELPKYYLRNGITEIIARIDDVFTDNFYKSNYSKGDKVFELKKKVDLNRIPSTELLSIWLYKLKLYRQNLITITPACFFIFYKGILIVFGFLSTINIYMLQHKVQPCITVNNFIKYIYLSFYDPFINYNKLFEFLSLVWVLIIYQDEIQKANELVFKVELLKDLEKVKDNKKDS